MSPRSIAVAQTCPMKGDVSANLTEHVRLVRAAGNEGAKIVIFPELSLTGYELGLAAALAFSESDQRLAPLARVAFTHSTIVIAGAPVQIDHRLCIGAFIIYPDGTIALYTKQRLGVFPLGASSDGVVPPAEQTLFSPGDRNPLIKFCDHTAAVAICADIGHRSHPQRAAELGADTYLASMFVIPADLNGDTSKLRRYAVEHSMMVAMANFGGPSGALTPAGRSGIWSATGELLVELESEGTGVAIVTETPRGPLGRRLVFN